MKAKLSLGENLRLFAGKNGASARNLGQDLSLSDGAISRYENNAAEPDINTLFKMAKIFNVDFNYLLDYHGHVRKSQKSCAEQRRGTAEQLSSMLACTSAGTAADGQGAGAFGSALVQAPPLDTAGLINEDREDWIEPPQEEPEKPPRPMKNKKEPVRW